MSQKSQLLIDVSNLVRKDAHTGIQRVVRSLLFEFIQNPPVNVSVNLVYANFLKSGFFYVKYDPLSAALTTEPKLPIFRLTSKRVMKKNAVFLGLDWNPLIIFRQRSSLNKIKQSGGKLYFLVYDLLPLLKPKLFYKRMNWFYRIWLNTVVRYDGVICISQTVAKELKQWIKLHFSQAQKALELDIKWFHLGADIENSIPSRGFSESEKRLIETLEGQLNFVSVGTVEPRKGYSQLLSAFELLWQQNININLIVVGKTGWKTAALVKKIKTHPELGKRLFWLECVSDEYLHHIYHLATCLIVASEAEGFGLVLIEAAKYGKPLILRDLPIFREIAGKNAFYFQGLEAEDIMLCIKRWLDLFQQQSHPTTDKLAWLTWQESAEQLKKVMSQLWMKHHHE